MYHGVGKKLTRIFSNQLVIFPLTDCSPPALLARFPQLYDSHSFQPSGAQWMKENMTQAPYMTYGVWPMGIFTFKPPHDGK